MVVSNNKFVNFEKYCKICKYKDLIEGEDPCNECLTWSTNVESEKPVNFKEKGVK